MSDEEQSYLVGWGRPPKQHRFSSTNQPRRRRRRKLKLYHGHDVLSALAEVLSEEVAVSLGGKTRKITTAEAFSRRLVRQALTSSFGESLKFAQLLRATGALDSVATLNSLQEQFEEARDEDVQLSSESGAVSNELLGMLRSTVRDLSLVSGELLDLLNCKPEPAGDPSHVEQVAKLHAAVVQALESLPPSDRDDGAPDGTAGSAYFWTSCDDDDDDEPVRQMPIGSDHDRADPFCSGHD